MVDMKEVTVFENFKPSLRIISKSKLEYRGLDPSQGAFVSL